MVAKKAQQWLISNRTVRFGETDAAGVLHFHHLLRWCHEAWETSLEGYGVQMNEIFPINPINNQNTKIALPIIHCEADFKYPVYTGDSLLITIHPEQIDNSQFQVKTSFLIDSKNIGSGLLLHKSIDIYTRKTCNLPTEITNWIKASSIGFKG